MGYLSLITALLPFIITELEQYKVISPQVGALITGIEGAGAVFANQVSTSPANATTFLAAISAALQVLQTQTKVSPVTLSYINALDKAVAAGIAASDIKLVDPTVFQPIAPIV